MANPKKSKKQTIDTNQKKTSETTVKQQNISDAFLDELKGAFTNFEKQLPETERKELYGDQKYLEQFREYFKKNHPNLLDKIDQKDLPVYIHALENKGFTLENITKNASKLNEEFKDEDTEIHVIEKSLSSLKKFCEDTNNNVPDDTFKKFADAAGFSHDRLQLDSDGKIKTLDDLPVLWKKFIEKEGITLGETSTEHVQNILTPNYNPTERVMVTVALTKIRKELKGSLKTAFDASFPLPVDIFSSYQDLLTFKTEWTFFLDEHASEIDEPLAKKLDSIIVTNGDIYRELLKSGRKFDDTKGFSQREQYFRRIFNKLATRQLFEEVQTTEKAIDHYATVIGETFKQFPPYVNDILNIYPFNAKIIDGIDTSFSHDIQQLSAQIDDLNTQYPNASHEEKAELRKKIKVLKQAIEERRWQAYVIFLRTKDAPLADVFTQLVDNKFNFSALSADQQQLLLNVLIKNKLEDTIKNKVSELLDVNEEELTQFVYDLFDLKKMDLIIPTRHGPVPLAFLKKEFLSSTRTQVPALSDLEGEIKNLPLNFVTQLTESNAAFFEDSEIFRSLYTDFSARNGKFTFNEGYRVKIQKNGKTVEGYLSPYCPIQEYNDTREERNGKELYLYSQPITSPSDTRELVPRPHEEGKPEIPVVIKDTEQELCDMEILDKKINLNGDAFGALLFGYVLGQQSMNMAISPEKEKELAEKFGALEVYKDKEDGTTEEEAQPTEKEESKKEVVKETAFDDERKKLKGYNFPEEQYKENNGFVEGTRLFIPFSDSGVPPEESGKAWLQMEITHIDKVKGTFKVKVYGGELRLGKTEGSTKELPMTPESLKGIRDSFKADIYKVPNTKGMSFIKQMESITSGSLVKDMDKNFGSVKLDGSKFVYTLGEHTGKEVTHFGIYQSKAIGEDVDVESGKMILYKIHPNSNGTITVSGDATPGNAAKYFPARDMDYASFMIFIKEKGLQPKSKEQVQAINAQAKNLQEETPTTVHGFSINNIVSFFKNGASKIKDSVKKFDDERTEELTDTLTNQGQLWGKIGGILSPFSRISSSFETMGMEAYLERDGRVWKKVEKRTKFYEDYDYTKLYTNIILPMLKGEITITPHYKIAAILLVHLKKGKGPYAKNLPIAEGQRIGKLLGADHQARYLAIREKRIRDLEQNAHIYGGPWADQVKNELVELEMRYIVHVMDGRHMGMNDNDKTKYYFQDKYSKKFCDELEGAYTGFYKQGTVEEGFTKNQDVNFEFARVEYFRQLADRPQQAIPFLKVMATKAINDTQWQVFESAVLAGILSGVFLNMTYSSTQSYIQKICRTRGFLPGIFAKDIKQQYKIQRLLDMFSGGKFTKETGYTPDKFSFRENQSPGGFIKKFVDRNDTLFSVGKETKGTIRNGLSKFLALTGENVDKKTLLDLYATTESMTDKLLLKEYIGKSNEKNESLDQDVQNNTSSLTGSILTKSQSVVGDMIKIDQYGFAGKDGDAKQNMADFSSQMEKAIPSGAKSEIEVKFFIEKFFNRFTAFSGPKKTELLKRLIRCRDHAGSPDVENILYYSVVGEIVGSIARNDAHMPDELAGALNAWKNFFKDNLQTILHPDIVADTFGSQYKIDLLNIEKNKPELDSWEEAAQLLDKQDSNNYINVGRTNEEKLQLRNKKKLFTNSNTKYINGPLYDLAEKLTRQCSQFTNNRFKISSEPIRSSDNKKLPPSRATGAKIKNAQVTEKVRQILEGKNIEEETDTDYIPESTYDPYDDMY